MANEDPPERAQLTLYLPESVAQRLKLTAASQNRPASRVVAELLDKHLPRLNVPQTKKKGGIPYS